MDSEIVGEFLKPERLHRAIVRLWHGRPDKDGELLGTAFFVGPRHALTAAHSVDGIPSEKLFLQLTWHGGFIARVLSVQHVPMNVDAALLEIASEASAPADAVVTVGDDLPLAIGAPLKIAGFADTGTSVELRPATVTALDAVANAAIIDPPPAKGMSGGPALSPDGMLRGMIWARDTDKGRGFLTPLSALRRLLSLVPPQGDAVPARLLEYPALDEDRLRLNHARKLLLRWRHLFAKRRGELVDAAERARILQRTSGILPFDEAIGITEFADSVATAMVNLPISDLLSATAYGLGVHYAIFHGTALNEAKWKLLLLDRKADREGLGADAYAYESMARVFESAVALVDFGPDRLPQGFGKPLHMENLAAQAAATRLLLAHEPGREGLTVVAANEVPTIVGEIIARPLRLFPDAARRMADGSIEVLANDFENRFRFTANHPRPSTQYACDDKLFATFPLATAGSSPYLGKSDGSLTELFLDGTCSVAVPGTGKDGWSVGVAWSNPDEDGALCMLHLQEGGRARTVRVGQSLPVAEANFAAALRHTDKGYLELRFSKWNTSVSVVDLEGFHCAHVFVQNPQWSLAMFLDPVSLHPIRPSRQLGAKILETAVVAGRWLVVGYFGAEVDGPLISIFDLTTDRKEPTFVVPNNGVGRADAYNLCVYSNGRDGFGIWFVRNVLYPVNEYRLCRWMWPNEQLEVFEGFVVDALYPVQE